VDCFAAVATAADGPVAVNLSRGSAHDPRFVAMELEMQLGLLPMPGGFGNACPSAARGKDQYAPRPQSGDP
jgi:hypothetical protein